MMDCSRTEVFLAELKRMCNSFGKCSYGCPLYDFDGGSTCDARMVKTMTRLIDADELREDWLQNGENEYVYDANAFLESIDDAPTVEAYSKEYVEQIRWERDMAISQLADIGIQLGEKADVQAVRHGKWLKFIDNGIEYQTCSECNYDMPVGGADSWCPACGRRMDGD